MLKIYIIVFFSLFAAVSPGIAADIPFTLEKGFIIVPAKISKDIAIEVAISTGSPDSFLDTGFIFQHKIAVKYTTDGPPKGHDDITINFADVTGLVVGDEKPVSMPMKLKSLDAIDKRVGRHITATLGTDYFKGKILQIDFKNKVLRFLDKSPIDYKEARKAPANADGKPLIF